MKKTLKHCILISLMVLCIGCKSNEFSLSNDSSYLSEQTSFEESKISSSKDDDQTSSLDTEISENQPHVDKMMTQYGVFSEGLYGEFKEKNAKSNQVKVEYKSKSETSYHTLDKELIRQKDNDTTRFDIVGLKAGIYDVKGTTSQNEKVQMNDMEVKAYDRSGYAHFKTISVGAYNNDGTLKNNAIVVYVTNETKNTVTAQINGKTYTGLSKILQNQKGTSPLCIRILDEIKTPTWNKIDYKVNGVSKITPDKVIGANGKVLPLPTSSNNQYTEEEIIEGGYNSLENGITKLDGLTNKIKYDPSKNEFDSYYNMLDINNAQNVTIEGVGPSAGLYQWGFTWKNCSSIEVRNLIFKDYTEDACSFEGSDENITSLDQFTTGHLWIHNNQFNIGKNNWDVCNEQDKHEGDGATDFKKNAYITISYNHYIKNHKTGLIGGGDSHLTGAITFHHNHYEECQSRLPLARQANMHMYNNFYDRSKTSMSIRANGYAFVEGCYFEKGSNPMAVDSTGKIKSYQNIINGSTGTNQATVVTTRDGKVNNNNLFGKNFDNDSSIFYYDAEHKVSDVTYLSSAEQAKIDCTSLSGPFKANKVDQNQVVNPTPETPDISENTPTKEVELLNPADLEAGNVSKNITKDIFTIIYKTKAITIEHNKNIFTSFDPTFTGQIKLGGSGTKEDCSIKFTITKSATIEIYAISGNTSQARQIKIEKDNGEPYLFNAITTASKLTTTLTAGTYYVASNSSGMNIGAIKIIYQ